MFKELDQWMNEIEEEYFDAYIRASKAGNEWKAAKRARIRAAEDVFYRKDELEGDYSQYCHLCVTDKAHEECITANGVPAIALVDVVTVNNRDYDLLVAVVSKKTENVGYHTLRGAEKKFEKKLSVDSGYEVYLDNCKAYPADVVLVEGRDEAWIRARAHKNMIILKTAIEEKIHKICDNIQEIDGTLDGYYVRGTNGKTAHLWRVRAGGWNIQRLHTRVLCKEVKTKWSALHENA